MAHQLRLVRKHPTLVTGALLLGARAADAAGTPAQKCQAAKNKSAMSAVGRSLNSSVRLHLRPHLIGERPMNGRRHPRLALAAVFGLVGLALGGPAQGGPAEPPASADIQIGQTLLDTQSDDVAGKGADVAVIGVSPHTGSPYLGPREALVVVNMFSDFQCPVCLRSADPIKQLVLDYPGKVKVVFRNNALAMHGRSKPAAVAALAAAKQGKFWQYHDKLFRSGAALDDASLRQYGQEIGLDLTRWDRDVADPKIAARIDEEARWAVTTLGAESTPTFFLNGVRQVGWGSYSGLKAMVGAELARAEALLAQGTPRSKIVATRIKAAADKNPRSEGQGPIDGVAWAKILTAE